MTTETATGAIYSHNLTVETPIDIDDMIYMLNPVQLPLLLGVNADGMALLPRRPVSNVFFDWLEEDVPQPRTTLAEDLDNSETDVTVATGEAVGFKVGDGIRIDDEVMIITAIDLSTDVFTVTRGSSTVSNTTVATHSTGAEVIGLGTILIEGAIAAGNFKGRDKYSNYAQIWTHSIQISQTEKMIRKYGVPSELTHQMVAGTQNMAQGIEQAAVYGVKFRHASNYRRQTGGLDYYVTSHEDTGTAWITVREVEDMMSDINDDGGSPNILMARSKAFTALNNTTDTRTLLSQTIDDARRGRRRAQTLITEFGDVTLVRNRNVKASDAFLFSRENFIYRSFRPMQTQLLAKTDDTEKWLMVSEGGFEVKGQAHMGKFSALNAAAEFPVDLQ